MDVDALDIPVTSNAADAELLRTCYEHAERSNHPSTHTAALIVDGDEVLVKGANTLPPGVEQKPERFEGENKHIYPNHAERDAIYRAARDGVWTADRTMVMPWLPCIPCAGAVITAGIATYVTHRPMIERTKEKWEDELQAAVELMREAGVDIRAHGDRVGADAYMHGEKWKA